MEQLEKSLENTRKELLVRTENKLWKGTLLSGVESCKKQNGDCTIHPWLFE